tara:strand:- start:1819 stop:2688 length:870 start_codon:yes stop_codon:yes gene_type:complete
MKRSTKITSVIIVFFLVITSVVVARTMIGNHFKKKFGKIPPPGIIVRQVEEKSFSNKLSTFGTAVSSQTRAYKIEKYEILNPINFNQMVKKGEIIVKLKNRNITAPFDGVIGKRNFSEDLEVSTTSILINFEDSTTIFSDVNIPEVFAPFIKIDLPVDVKVSGYKDKNFDGTIESLASRISEDTRSLKARIKINNPEFKILPGSLLEFSIKYNLRKSLGIPDTSVLVEGDKTYIYKVDKGDIAKKSEIKVGDRLDGYIEVFDGIIEGEKIVAEGLKKVRPNGKINPILK